MPLMVELEEKIHAVRVMGRVKAAHEVGMVVEGLKAKVRYASCRLILQDY